MLRIRDIVEEILALEGRVEDFHKKYSYFLDPRVRSVFVEKDPSKNHKYLPWMGKVASDAARETRFTQDDADELINNLNLFDRKARGVDIYSFKTLDQFNDYMVKLSGKKSRRAEIEGQAALIFLNNRFRIVGPEAHQACRHFGGGTRWCIATSSVGHWDEYYNERGNSIVIVIDRINQDKWAIVQPGGDANLQYADIYDSNDNTLGRHEQEQFLELLKKETDAEGNDAYEAINDFISGDYAETRMDQWQDEQLDRAFEEGGKDRVASDLISAIEKDLNIEDLEDDWDVIVKKAFSTGPGSDGKEEYDSFLARIWYDTASYHGHDSAGYFRDLEGLKKVLDDSEDLDKLIAAVKEQYIFVHKIDDLVEKYLTPEAYNTFWNKWDKKYAEALDEVAAYLDAVLNDPKQTMFPFGGKLKDSPRSFKELLKLLKKLGYPEMSDDLAKLSGGEYNKEFFQEVQKKTASTH